MNGVVPALSLLSTADNFRRIDVSDKQHFVQKGVAEEDEEDGGSRRRGDSRGRGGFSSK